MLSALAEANRVPAARELRPEEITAAEIRRRWWLAGAVLVEALAAAEREARQEPRAPGAGAAEVA
jgi:hypothetical protein